MRRYNSNDGNVNSAVDGMRVHAAIGNIFIVESTKNQ